MTLFALGTTWSQSAESFTKLTLPGRSVIIALARSMSVWPGVTPAKQGSAHPGGLNAGMGCGTADSLESPLTATMATMINSVSTAQARTRIMALTQIP